ncbi:sensor domain-containing diguanylate cyclase [Fundidesulfovibrio terrae]|uniref:sensor domain-containing diguanylate cyclase n=1 Tax=Fundidesulfovibrio terrae TaxID=2922866 RepID=UPI001FAF03D2|nr:diguanylate cyclase [Fundidesulfovibrio terrae]
MIQKNIRIGILANRGIANCLEDWGGMIRSVAKALPEYDFTLVPLPFESVDDAVVAGSIDFVVANPAIYVNLEVRHDVIRIATLINHAAGRASDRFGGVFFTRADRKGIDTLGDLRGKKLVATARYSLGGWLMGWHTLRQHGVDPDTELASLWFASTHNDAVDAVLGGQADAGVVRTDTLERMAAEGLLRLDDIKVITPPGFRPDPTFPFLYSTDLVPEWPFAKLSHTSDELARRMAAALLTMRPGQGHAVGHEGCEWTVPLPYESIHAIMRELRVPPYEEFGRVSVRDFIGQHLPLVLLVVLLLMSLTASVAYFRSFNKRLHLAMDKLRQAEAELTVQANTDILTGLRNRKRFNEIVEREIVRALRYKRPLAMILLDLDHFKSINDRFGHPVGDSVLIAVAGLIASLVRKTDFAARIGGEEFAVLMPETGLEDAADTAERIRAEVESAVLAQTTSGPASLTVSIGVADVCPSIQNYSSLYTAADQALYMAKKSGRNRVEKSTACLL